MIARLIRWSAHNAVLVLIGTVFVILAGVWSVARTPLDALPDLSDVQVIVYTDIRARRHRSSRTRSPIRWPPP